jgi:hypothetical protein
MYLVHPFRSHDYITEKEELEFLPKKLSVYESLGASWVFIVFNGLIRIWLINMVIYTFYGLTDPSDGLISQFYDGDGFTGFYFLILSTILDVIFYPLFTLFLIQFWEFVIRGFGKLLEVEGDLGEKAHDIMAVALSSHVLMIVPIFGNFAQKFASLVLMYAGLRKQLNASPAICVCIMLTPILIFLGMASMFLVVVLLG